ncbi:ATPase involved in chromosome partitioning [Spongiibacter sp. IMCC21906]|uniref:MinD/ParA family protein n=1 Tax=Spongiibacter sp. IMCC21906 TaxID=1620392 RepID=UPI00062DECE6|nr:MinD/ParA family protein [Spongiibacter sp. IMCC21906]AKH69991.1 ATPase involved in chromosome partitioning [Spongiibacter sp. IMCC21906]
MVKPVQVIAVSGGKGGVGKTNVSINLGCALAEAGQRVALLDADFGLANVDVLLGLKATKNIEQVLDGECSLLDIMLEGPSGLKIIPASSGTRRLTRMDSLHHAGIIRAFSELASQLDVLIIDTAAGIGDSVVSFVAAAQDVLLVVCDEPSSITDTYAMIKVLSQDYGKRRIRILANMVKGETEGRALFAKLQGVCDRFLDVGLLYAGTIPFDEALRNAVRKQQLLLTAAPGSPAARALKRLAEEVSAWPMAMRSQGHLEFFVEQLLSSESIAAEAQRV